MCRRILIGLMTITLGSMAWLVGVVYQTTLLAFGAGRQEVEKARIAWKVSQYQWS